MRTTTVLALTGLLAASCATAPTANEPVKAAPVKTMTYQELLPSLVKTFFPNGDSSGWIKNTYDDKGRLTLQETYNGNGTLTERKTGSPHGPNWRVSTENAQTGDLVSYQDIDYDAQGKVLSETFLNAKGEPQSSNVYQYNKDGVKTEWIAKTGSSDIQARTEYLLDSGGHNVKTEVYDGADKLLDVFASTFSPEGRLISTQGTDAAGSVIEKTFLTWDGNRLVHKESLVPYQRTWDYVYTDQDSPSLVTISVRGKVTEKQEITYTGVTRTKTLQS